jgi:ATP-dependent DNA ligase
VTVTGRKTSPFATKVTERDVTWVNPDVVIEVTYQSWPARGRLRGAVLRAVTTDRDPAQIGREPSA